MITDWTFQVFIQNKDYYYYCFSEGSKECILFEERIFTTLIKERYKSCMFSYGMKSESSHKTRYINYDSALYFYTLPSEYLMEEMTEKERDNAIYIIASFLNHILCIKN